MPVGIKDIAKKLNISKTTVSRALRDHPDIKRDTKQMVLAAAEQLGYQPNYIARALSTRQTFTVGLILPHIRHTFFTEALHGIENVFYEAGYSILIAPSNERASRELENIKTLISKKVDGFLISVSSETDDIDRFSYIEKHKIPVVFFDRKVPGINAPTVGVDDVDIYNKIVSHLQSLSCRRIAYLTGPIKGFAGRTRLEGFKHALKRYGLPFKKELVIEGSFDNERYGEFCLMKLLERGSLPDAVVTAGSMQAIGLIKAAREKGIKIPDDLKVSGHLVTPLTELIEPRITAVKFPISDMGAKAAQLLLEKIVEGQNSAEHPKHIIMDTELLIRESTVRYSDVVDIPLSA
jgi:DNA-binding LacI/PurR family transcriptional regulator